MKSIKLASGFAVSALALAIAGQAVAQEDEAEGPQTLLDTTYSGTVSTTINPMNISASGSASIGANVTLTNGPFSGVITASTDDGELDLGVGSVKYDNGTISFGQLSNLYNHALVTGTRGSEDQNFTGSEWSIADSWDETASIRYTFVSPGPTVMAQVGGYVGDGVTLGFDGGDHEEDATTGNNGLYDWDDNGDYEVNDADLNRLNIQLALEQEFEGIGTALASLGYVMYGDHTASGEEFVAEYESANSDGVSEDSTGLYDNQNVEREGGLGLIYLGFESEQIANIATFRAAYRHATYDYDADSVTLTNVTFDEDDEQVEGAETEVKGKGVPGLVALAGDFEFAGANLGVATTTVLGFDTSANSTVEDITEIQLTAAYAVNDMISVNAGYTINDLMVGDEEGSQADTTAGGTTTSTQKIDTYYAGGSYTMNQVSVSGRFDSASYTEGSNDGETFTALSSTVSYAFEDGMQASATVSRGSVEEESTDLGFVVGASYTF